MKIGAADIPRLQLSLIAALLMLAIGTGSVLFSLDRIQAAKIARTAAQTERNDLDAKLRQVRREENEIRWKSALFTELQTRGGNR